MLIYLIVLELCPGQDFSKMGDNSKGGKIELWFFDTALHLNALYNCVKFKQIISKYFQVMLSTRQWTDGQGLPSGSIKIRGQLFETKYKPPIKNQNRTT
jgi:hypothetical protein